VAFDGRGVLCTMDSGGGKTTLLLGALVNPKVHFLSDDSPLISRAGNIFAFPMRIGNRERPSTDVKDEDWQIRRLASGEQKWVISPRHYGEQEARAATPSLLLIGRRAGAGNTCLLRTSWLAVGKTLLRNLVLGKGLRQGPEIVLRKDGLDWLRLGAIAGSRAVALLALTLRTRWFWLQIGPDRDEAQKFFRNLVATKPDTFRGMLYSQRSP